MRYKYSGGSICAHPPILTISANKLQVVFKDKHKLKNLKFRNISEKKRFIDWLTTI
jgi:hypothetical protein